MTSGGAGGAGSDGVSRGEDPTSQRRRGGWLMIATGWAIALIVATIFFGGALDKKHNPNSARVLAGQGGGEVVLRANDAGHYYAEGTMNGNPVVFLLDTGATQIAVPESIARKVGLTPGARSIVSTANGTTEVRQTKIKKITIGNITIKNLNGAILPNMEGDAILLGMNALKQLNWTQKNNNLHLSIP